MNTEKLHTSISESTGNESNICQIYAIKTTRLSMTTVGITFRLMMR